MKDDIRITRLAITERGLELGTVRRCKTEECLWCGLSEARGAKLKPRPTCFGDHAKFECVDRTVCDERIKSRILAGPR